jgi:hypothetical protein
MGFILSFIYFFMNRKIFELATVQANRDALHGAHKLVSCLLLIIHFTVTYAYY